MFLSIVLLTLCSRVALVISKDGVYAVVDIIIIDPIYANLLLQTNFKGIANFKKGLQKQTTTRRSIHTL